MLSLRFLLFSLWAFGCILQFTSAQNKHIGDEKVIFPGTNWCGRGNHAKNFNDLGKFKDTDICCRSHDQCPISIKGHTTKFGLTNTSGYYKSDCKCDDALYDCLKKVNSAVGFTVGDVFFNIEQLECIEQGPDKKWRFRKARHY